MTVEDVVSKIENARKVIGLINNKDIEFYQARHLSEIISPKDIVDILEEHIYLLKHLKITEQIINYRLYKEEET